MNFKLDVILRGISSFIEEDGFAYCTYTNLTPICKYDTCIKYLKGLIAADLIEDLTKNGYAKKFKVKTVKECPDFIFNPSLTLTLKAYLLEQWKEYKDLGKIETILITREHELEKLGVNGFDIISNAKIIVNKISIGDYMELSKDEDGYKIVPKSKTCCCQYCGETDPSKFAKNMKSVCKKCSKKHIISPLLLAETLHKRCSGNAKRRGIEYNLTIDYIKELLEKQECKCYYSNIQLENDYDNKQTYPTIDRIDNTKGYIKNNVCICTYTANIMKRDLTTEQFKEQIKLLYKNIDNF